MQKDDNSIFYMIYCSTVIQWVVKFGAIFFFAHLIFTTLNKTYLHLGDSLMKYLGM